MGGSTNQTTTSTGSANPNVGPTVNRLLGGINTALDTPARPFNQSLYAGVGGQTTGSWASALNASRNPEYAAGINGAISDYSRAASGGDAGANDPYYKQLGDNTLRDVNAMFTGSGRFGSGSHVNEAVSALGDVNNANVAADRAWQTQGAQMLPGLLQAGQLPAGIQGAVGAAQDADRQATRQGAYDLFERTNNAQLNRLGQIGSIFNGTTGAAGTTSTTSQPATPWWQSLLSAGIGLA